MPQVEYVYPNVSGVLQRGGLLERWHLAQEHGCEYIEVPADFIKNKTEIRKTGLDLGAFLSPQAISEIYTKDQNISQNVKYILHTEPSLSRKDGYGISYQPPLKWYDQQWLESFTNMIISISKYFGTPTSVIEIHPGDKRNTFSDIINSAIYLTDKYQEEFHIQPNIMIENRTGQFISTGKDIFAFWQFFSKKYSHLTNKLGIVLDIQQLYTVTKSNFLSELKLIPIEALKGFHIHHKHRVPNLSDVIPWKEVFSKIKSINNKILLNPEIHHKNKVKDAIRFCYSMLN